MSEVEDAAVTVARLLKTKLRVVKDNNTLAAVTVSGEWQNNDALKTGDGQVTVGLVECTDQKLELTGKIRRCTSAIRVNVWTTDDSNATENAKVTRSKILEEVKRVFHENRTHPNQTLYSFIGLGASSQGSKAFSGDTEAAPSLDWTELSDSDYQKLWYSDDERCQISSSESGKYAVLLFAFKIESRENTVKQMTLCFEGYGTAPGGDGVTVKVWNHTAGAWQKTQIGEVIHDDDTLTITLTADLPSYIDSEGYTWFLARTTNASTSQTPAVLCCDNVSCLVVVNGISYCDVAGYRNLDRTDLNPFIYRTELAVKSWFIENIGV